MLVRLNVGMLQHHLQSKHSQSPSCIHRFRIFFCGITKTLLYDCTILKPHISYAIYIYVLCIIYDSTYDHLCSSVAGSASRQTEQPFTLYRLKKSWWNLEDFSRQESQWITSIYINHIQKVQQRSAKDHKITSQIQCHSDDIPATCCNDFMDLIAGPAKIITLGAAGLNLKRLELDFIDVHRCSWQAPNMLRNRLHTLEPNHFHRAGSQSQGNSFGNCNL